MLRILVLIIIVAVDAWCFSIDEFGPENSSKWANWGAVPGSTKDNCNVKVYVRNKDNTSYYLHVTDRGGSLSLDAEIDGERFRITRIVGSRVWVVKPKVWKDMPTITVMLAK